MKRTSAAAAATAAANGATNWGLLDEEAQPQHGLDLTHVKFDVRQRCPPLSIARFCSLGMIPFVLGLIAVTVFPFWHFVHDGSLSGNIKTGIFHVLLGLLVVSYFQTVFTDAGSVPPEWHALVSAQRNPGYPKCRTSKQYKPLRSHYDSMSQRLILNEDHFCPWVANVVGFRNRKFFILFCVYTMLTSLFAVFALAPFAFNGVNNNKNGSGPSERAPTLQMSALCMMAVILDATFAFALTLFSLSHLYMAARNQTSIEDSDVSKRYDRGWKENLKSVFGSDVRLWALPVYGNGPQGDGVHWQLSDGTWDGHADRPPPPPPQVQSSLPQVRIV